MSFVEEPPNQRVNQERAVEALATGADTLAVACPFCMTMMEDGVNARKGDQSMCVKDISELLWDAVQDGAEAAPEEHDGEDGEEEELLGQPEVLRLGRTEEKDYHMRMRINIHDRPRRRQGSSSAETGLSRSGKLSRGGTDDE